MNFNGFQVCPGVTYVRVKDLAETFRPFGHTYGSFSAWLTAMHLPKIQMPDGHQYVSYEAFQLALTTLSSIGSQLDVFITPTPHPSNPNLALNHGNLPPDYIVNNWRMALAQTFLCTRIAGVSDKVYLQVRTAFEEAGTRLAVALARMTEHALAEKAKEAYKLIPEGEIPDPASPISHFDTGAAAVIRFAGAHFSD